MSIAQWFTLHGLVTVLAVMLYAVTSHVMNQRRHPAAAVAWILAIVLVPYAALPAYLLFGMRKLPRPRPSPTPVALRAVGSAEPAADPPLRVAGPDDWAIDTLAALRQPPPAAYADLRVHADGAQARAALLAHLAAARRRIDICTFILGRDAFAEDLVARLAARARDGVRVRLLVDGLGRLMGGMTSPARLRALGIDCQLFVPPLLSSLRGRTNLRNHRKLVVVDADTPSAALWAGGRNLAAEYFDGSDGAPGWRDLSFDLRGPLVAQAQALFDRDWAFATRAPLRGRPADGDLDASAATEPPRVVRGGAQVVASGPDQVDDTLHDLLLTAAYRAQHRIALATPYFVPEPSLLTALSLAARRGIAVDLLLPRQSNHRLSDLARARALRTLAMAGGRIWLAPAMLHAKCAVFDETLALAGSANLDGRSLFLNYELMVAFHGVADIRRFRDWFDAERAAAARYVAQPAGLVRDMAEGMVLLLGFQL